MDRIGAAAQLDAQRARAHRSPPSRGLVLAKRREHPAHQRRGALRSGIDDHVRAIAVEGLARLEQLREPRARIGGGEQWPACVVASALPEALQARAQVDHGSRLAHQPAVGLVEDGAAAGGYHAAIAARELGEQGRFAAPESFLAFDFEDRGHRHAGALNQDAVGVDELAPQALRERPAERRLAGAHHAYEKDICARHQRPRRTPGFENSRKKSPGGPGLEDCRVARQRTVSVSLTMRGVTKIKSSVLLSTLTVRLKSTPTIGMSARKGTLSTVLRVSCS